MLPTWKTMLLRNLLLIAAIESIGLPKAGCALFNLAILSGGKLAVIFNQIDNNRDGVISREDFVSTAEKFAYMENFDPSQKEAARQAYNLLFTYFISASGGQDVPLTVKLLTESVKMQKDNPEFKKIIWDAIFSLVSPMKLEQDGYLNYNEYNRIFENVGFLDGIFTKGAFGLIDANRDGKVSVAEICDAMVAYITTDNPLSAALSALLGLLG